jgi:hypothetical protein
MVHRAKKETSDIIDIPGSKFPIRKSQGSKKQPTVQLQVKDILGPYNYPEK